MSRGNNQALEAIHSWLQSHAASPHTYRAYYREFERIQTWLLMEGGSLIKVTSGQLSAYLNQYAAGELSARVGRPRVARSARTVLQARSALYRMFDVLQRTALRHDNPVNAVTIDLPTSGRDAPPSVLKLDPHEWQHTRHRFRDQPAPEPGSREPMERAIAIAELSYWTAMRRSELAAAMMADFKQEAGQWYIAVRRFGHDDIDMVHVPTAAMRAVGRYRRSRGLSALPVQTERDVPLISRIRIEHPVDPWTISHSLKLVSALTGQPTDSQETALSLRALRNCLISDGLAKGLPERDLARHVRSRYAVQLRSDALSDSSFTSDFGRFAELAG